MEFILSPASKLILAFPKTGKGKLRQSQRAWIAEARRFGALVFEFHTVEELAEALDDARRMSP